MVRFNAHSDIRGTIAESFTSSGEGVDGIEIIAQEKNGKFIVSFVDKKQTDKPQKTGELCTCIGFYNPFNKVSKTIYRHETVVNVIEGTLNEQNTLLSFVILEPANAAEGKTNSRRKLPKGFYKVFLVEVDPQRTVYNLNLDRMNYIKLKFLYGGDSHREDKLLVCLHKEAIALYHINLSRMGEHLVMSGQPKISELSALDPRIEGFIWCQWESNTQRLYVVTHGRSSDPRDSPKLTGTTLLMYQFYPKSKQQKHVQLEMECPLDVNISQHNSLQQKAYSKYLDLKPCVFIPDLAYNLMVIQQSSGSLCFCVQNVLVRFTLSGQDSDESTQLQYHVVMVHHNKTLKITCPSIKGNEATKVRLHYCVAGDYIAVYLPGHFIHLLNTTLELEPCHHILLHDKINHRVFPDTSTVLASRSLCHVNLGHKNAPYMYDVVQGTAYSCVLNKDGLLELYQETNDPNIRLAIMHYSLLKIKDASFVKRLIELHFDDPASPELENVFGEYLVASTYAAMRKEFDRDVLRLIPFTTQQTSKGMIEQNIYRLTYTTFKHAIVFATRVEQKMPAAETGWDVLQWDRRQERDVRFDLLNIYKKFVSVSNHGTDEDYRPTHSPSHSPVSSPETERRRNLGVFSRLTKRFSIDKSTNKTESVLETHPKLSSHSDADTKRLLAFAIDTIRDHFTKHLLLREVDGKTNAIATNYVNAQCKQAEELCQIIWSMPSSCPSGPNILLCKPVTMEQSESLQVCERFHLAARHLAFPLHSGFTEYFTKLAFHVLDFRLFLHYIERDVLKVTTQFVNSVIQDLPDNASGIRKKHALITKLPKNEAELCLREWQHPIRDQYFCRQYVNSVLQDEIPSGLNTSQNRSSTVNSMSSLDSLSDENTDVKIYPLDSLISFLITKETKMKKSQQTPKRMGRTGSDGGSLPDQTKHCVSNSNLLRECAMYFINQEF